MATSETQSYSYSQLRWGVCILLLLATTLNYMDRVALNQTINRIRVEFDLNDLQYSQLESAFAIAFGVGTLIAGWLVDRVNVRWIYPVVVLGWSISGFVTGYATGFLSLLMCRIALGLFEAGNWPCGIRTCRTVMKPEERSMGNALFQSGTALGAIITPQVVLLCLYYYGENTPGVWAIPFRIIGAIGILWVIAWLLFVPGRLLPPPGPPASGSTPFHHLFWDRRFWLMVIVVIGVNTSWHSFRIWMPRYLKEQQAYSEIDIQWLGTWYYLAADIGSWTVGLLTLYLVKRGQPLFRSRMISFVFCGLAVMVSLAIPYLDRGPFLTWTFLVYGFGALGLFATYFTLSQELSGQHQGKVTGTLGAINAVYLAIMANVQGRFVQVIDGAQFDRLAAVASPLAATAFVRGSARFDQVLAWAWIPSMIAVIAVLLFWPRTNRSES